MMGIKENCPNDGQTQAFEVPAYVQFLLDNKFLATNLKNITIKMKKETLLFITLRYLTIRANRQT